MVRSQSAIVLQRGDPEDTVTEEWVAEVRGDLRRKVGVSEDELGAPRDISQLGEANARDLLAKLIRYQSDKSLYFTSSSKIARSWNARKDDLGVGGRSDYPTILHYVKELDKLTRKSLGGEWPEALRQLKSSTIRLAGGTYFVHPRMLYFAAAAQISTNKEAGRSEGEGHYLAPAAVFEEIRMIRQAALTIDDLGAKMEEPQLKLPLEAVKRVGPEGAAVVATNLIMRLRSIADLQARQAETSEPGKIGHPEAGLGRYLDPEKAKAIAALPETVSGDVEGLDLCRELLTLLDVKPRKKQAHGWGAADPHGSHHAMGMAMDIFYGTAAGGYANFARELKGDAAANIVTFFVRQYGHEYEYGPWADTPKGIMWEVKHKPLAGIAFAQLLVDHATEGLALLDAAVAETATEPQKSALREYEALRHSIVQAIRARHAKAVKLRGRRKIPKADAVFRDYIDSVTKRSSSAAVSQHKDPATFLRAAQSAAADYPALFVSLSMLYPQHAEEALDSTSEPDLATPVGALEELSEKAGVAYQQKSRSGMRKALPGGLKRAIERAAEGKLILDQPPELMKGLAGVKGVNLQSWHHWQIRGWRSVMLWDKAYEATLVADMVKRSPSDMREILQVMVQSPAGYRAVFGDDDGKMGLASVRGALDKWVSAEESAGEGADVVGLLEDVRRKLPPPELEGLDPKRKSLASDLYERGFYDAALTVAGKQGE